MVDGHLSRGQRPFAVDRFSLSAPMTLLFQGVQRTGFVADRDHFASIDGFEDFAAFELDDFPDLVFLGHLPVLEHIQGRAVLELDNFFGHLLAGVVCKSRCGDSSQGGGENDRGEVAFHAHSFVK